MEEKPPIRLSSLSISPSYCKDETYKGYIKIQCDKAFGTDEIKVNLSQEDVTDIFMLVADKLMQPANIGVQALNSTIEHMKEKRRVEVEEYRQAEVERLASESKESEANLDSNPDSLG